MKAFKTPDDVEKDNIEAVLAAFNKFQDSLTAQRNEKMGEFNRRLNEDRANRQRVQERLAFNLARVSPTASLSLATAALAGTSLELKNRFYDEANAYRTSFNDFLTEKTGVDMSGRMIMWKVNDDGEEPEPIDPHEIPAFRFRNASLAESVNAALPDMGILAVLNLFLFSGAFIAFLRYDVR